MRPRAVRLLRSHALGAIVAQVWQAVGSFGLQIVAAWMLGAAGLGTLSLCLGIIVFASAVASGMVGDSLVILERHVPAVRGGLQVWALLLFGVSMTGIGAVMAMSGMLTPRQAVFFALALGGFQLEELVRRVFMATMKFWRLVVIDSSALASTLLVVAAWAVFGRIQLETFFVAIAIGQVVGIVVGIVLLPAEERVIAPMRGAAIRQVAGFGVWRGAQVSVPPLLLTLSRVIVTVLVSRAALGEVEAARIFVAPALLVVQGLGSYLLSSYVRDKQAALPVLTRRAWRVSGAMVGAAVLVGALLVVAAPVVGHWVTGPSFEMDRLAVGGWALYVAGSASFQPFASLAAVRGRQQRVFLCRCGDASFALLLLLLVLGVAGLSASFTPYVLACGLFVGGLAVRQFVLNPLRQAKPVGAALPVS